VRRLVLPLALSFVSLAAPACDKAEKPETAAPEPKPKPELDAIDRAMIALLTELENGDFKALKAHCVEPLTHDLSPAAFADLAAIVGWLGGVEERTVTHTDMSHGGGQRWWHLQFAQGDTVELELAIDEQGKLIGFHFEGPGYIEAEHGVIADEWREFKVYDFVYLDADGQPLPEGTPIRGKIVEYEMVVGGIEALIGQHHLKVEKIVFNSKGKEVFHRPIEFDTKFDENAEGIPRGVVRGNLEVPGPGKWEMELKISDMNAHRDIDYRHAFETIKAPKK
jgi:hypothetical protein